MTRMAESGGSNAVPGAADDAASSGGNRLWLPESSAV